MNELVSNLWYFARSCCSFLLLIPFFTLYLKLDWHWRKRDVVHSGSGTGQWEGHHSQRFRSSEEILSEARDFDVALLIVADPFGYGLSSLFLFDWILWNAVVG
jgi:hypothetical protein